jgi:hypothetical protein
MLSRAGYSAQMMLFADLTKHVASDFEHSVGTVERRAKELRAAGDISTGKQGPGRGAIMTPRDAVNLIIGCALDHVYGGSLTLSWKVREVCKLRSFGEIIRSKGFGVELTFATAPNAGDMLMNLIADYQTGRLPSNYDVEIIFNTNGAQVMFSASHERNDLVGGFGIPSEAFPKPRVHSHTKVFGRVFAEIAAKLLESPN